MALDSQEQSLLAKITEGDAQGLELLFRQYYHALCQFAYPKVRNWDAAEDIVQEVFVKLWNKRDQISIQTSLKSYLYTATKNLCLNYIQKQKRDIELNQVYLEKQELAEQDPEAKSAEVLQQKIQEALETLPPKCREVFTLSRYEGLTYQEIADTMGISPKTVENQMGKALSLMRKSLSPFLKVGIWLGGLIWLFPH